MSFKETYNLFSGKDIEKTIYSITSSDVEFTLEKKTLDISDFAVLVSPAAEKYLDVIAEKSRDVTLKRFGKTIQLFIPLYLSNFCENRCVYCGFKSSNTISRIVLNESQILEEVKILKDHGFEHILLVTGESPSKAGFEYIKNAVKIIKPYFSLISIEVQPLEQHEYEELIDLGLTCVYVYQETYNKENYAGFHPSGKKSDFYYRLETPDRMGKAGIHKIGIGSLIGLDDWRIDAYYTALHLQYLKKKYWKTNFSISFPRLRPHTGIFSPPFTTTERDLMQLICAYRLLDENVELSLSVRERAVFRDNAIKFGITTMSAGSKTNPGSYSCNSESLKQFEEHDSRTAKEIETVIRNLGYDPVWKGWDPVLQGSR